MRAVFKGSNAKIALSCAWMKFQVRFRFAYWLVAQGFHSLETKSSNVGAGPAGFTPNWIAVNSSISRFSSFSARLLFLVFRLFARRCLTPLMVIMRSTQYVPFGPRIGILVLLFCEIQVVALPIVPEFSSSGRTRWLSIQAKRSSLRYR